MSDQDTANGLTSDPQEHTCKVLVMEAGDEDAARKFIADRPRRMSRYRVFIRCARKTAYSGVIPDL